VILFLIFQISPCLKATTAGKAWYWQWGKWPLCTEYYMWHRQGQWWLCVDFIDEEDNWRDVLLDDINRQHHWTPTNCLLINIPCAFHLTWNLIHRVRYSIFYSNLWIASFKYRQATRLSNYLLHIKNYCFCEDSPGIQESNNQ
jgi:hypothetical protein